MSQLRTQSGGGRCSESWVPDSVGMGVDERDVVVIMTNNIHLGEKFAQGCVKEVRKKKKGVDRRCLTPLDPVDAMVLSRWV